VAAWSSSSPLANGASLTETAEQFDVTRNTVRTPLQRAMSKTDTRRQGGLIRLVLGGPAGMVAPGSEWTIPVA